MRKPHRIAFLVPELVVEGGDAPYAAEVGLLLWVACIEACQRHPELAVHDAESTPLVAQDGHFTPDHARPGAEPTDAFYDPTRRDELVWLELALPRAGAVRLHTLARGGKHETFEALGRNTGDQVHQAIERWLTARGLGALPRRFEAVEAGDILAAVRVFAPVLGEQARAHVELEPLGEAQIADPATDRTDLGGDAELAAVPAGADRAGPEPSVVAPSEGEPAAAGPSTDAARAEPSASRGSVTQADRASAEDPRHRSRGSPRVARMLAGRLTATLKAPALRLIALALREDLDDLILAVDPDQPQALLRRFRASPPRRRDPAQSGLEIVAGAGMAALCRPEQLDAIRSAAIRLADDGRVDEGVRLLERAVAIYPESSDAHIALIGLVRRTGRLGAWLAQAQHSAALHGCPLDPGLPCNPDQIQIDLLVADALLHVGRLGEAIDVRASRLGGREASWPRHTRILGHWRTDPGLVARCYAREGHQRGDPGRALEGYGRIEPDDAVDVAFLLDALVAVGRDDEVALAWSQFGLGKQITGPVARIAAARCLLTAGEWRRGIEELWRVELTEPGSELEAAVARSGVLLSCAPLEVLEAALAERVAIGATTLARRMARDIADFVPGAARSSIVLRALGKPAAVEFDPAWLAGFATELPGRRAIDALFAEHAGRQSSPAIEPARQSSSAIERAGRQSAPAIEPGRQSSPTISPAAGPRNGRGDRLVNGWLEVVFTEASDDDPAGIAQAAAYVAGQALGRYLAATTTAPSPLSGGYRTVAAEALALVARHRRKLSDRAAGALLGVLDPLLRRIDRWLGSHWLAVVERSCAIDERAGGDVGGFVQAHPTVAARILGPEETAVLAASIARLSRERPEGWASAVAAQAGRLASHTGRAAVDEWADAVAAQHAAREIETEDAIDVLHTACYLAEGKTAVPCVHAARVLLGAGRASAAVSVLCAGLGAADAGWRTAQLAALAEAWSAAELDLPLEPVRAASQLFQALQTGDPARAEKLGRLAVAIDPGNPEAHRNLGIALVQQNKIPEALHHLTRGAAEQATQILCGLLYQRGQLPEAIGALDYASRWYVRAEQWLNYGGIAYAAMDNPRAVAAYACAYRLDPDAFDASQLNAYAGVLGEIGDCAACEAIGHQLLAVAGDDLTWKTNAWAHLANASLGQGRFDQAIELAERAVASNPLPDNAAGLAALLERARSRTATTPQAVPPPGKPRAPVFGLLEAGDFAAAAALLGDASWRVRRAALAATRFRQASENHVEVTPRARAAAAVVLAETAGLTDPDAMIARELALAIRAQAYFARDPAPPLGDRMTRDAFHRELRARGGIVLGDPTPPTRFIDRVAVPDGRLSRVSDYVALIRDLAVLSPREALAQFDLDDAGYLEVATAWGTALAADPTLAHSIAAGLAKR